MKRRIKQGIAYVLSAVLTIGFFSFVMPQTSIKAEAEGTNRNIQTGASVLMPTMTVVEGEWEHGSKSRVTYAPIVYYGNDKTKNWLVIGNNGTGAVRMSEVVTLFASDGLKENQAYNSSNTSNSYKNSEIKSVVDSFYSSLFSEKERSAIVERILSYGWYVSENSSEYCNGVSDEDGTKGNLWLLSTREADHVGQQYRVGKWWLRSPGWRDHTAASVGGSAGWIQVDGDNILNKKKVRPAFNLNLSSIILTSAAEGGKISGNFGSESLSPVENHTGDEWKLTIHDPSRDELEVRRIDNGNNVSGSCEIKIEYKNAKTGTNECISAILVDKNDNVLHYGRIVDLSTSEASSNGEAYITIPFGLINGSTYTLKFMSEQYNGDKMTDFASAFDPSREITFTVGPNKYSNTRKSIQFGSEALGVAFNSSSAATLYFDSYEDGSKSDKWVVIGYNTNGVSSMDGRMTLLAYDKLGKSAFDSSENRSNDYSKSTLKSTIEGIVIERFNGLEKEAIIPRNLAVGTYSRTRPYCKGVANTPVSNALLWPLSQFESDRVNAGEFFYSYTDNYWTRSPGPENYFSVNGDNQPISVNLEAYVRPAFYMDLSSILFISAAEGGKNSGLEGENALRPINNYYNNMWKATLHDSSRDVLEVKREGNSNVPSGSIIKVVYKNATTGTNEYLSAILVDSDNNILQYGRLLDLSTLDASSDGEAYVTIPAGLTEGSTYTLKFMSEQYNGDKMTDFASEFDSSRDVSFTVGSNSYSGNGKNIQFGSEVLGEEVNTTNAANLYYGSYDYSGTINYDSWRVIGYNTNGVASSDGRMTLFARDLLWRNYEFLDSNEYSNSVLNSIMDYIVSECFSEIEKNAVIKRKLWGGSGLYGEENYNNNNIGGKAFSDAVIWPLSVYEANILNEDIRNIGDNWWWLRTPGVSDHHLAIVGSNGIVNCEGMDISSLFGIRPAFNLDLSSIIFTSAAEGGKLSADVGSSALVPVNDYNGKDWKLTLHDPSRDNLEVRRIDKGNNISQSCEMKIEYKNAVTGPNEYLSVILVNSNNDILYYGRIVDLSTADASSDGIAYVTVPDINESTYTLKFISEQYNGDKMTDYASAFDPSREISFTVGHNSFSGNGKAIQIGSKTLGEGVNTINAATLYFDSYDNNGTKQSDAWRVIGYETDGVASADGRMTILSGNSLAKTDFGYHSDYSISKLKSSINSIATTRLTKLETDAVIKRTLLGKSGMYGKPDNNGFNLSGEAVLDALMWPLSMDEAEILDDALCNISDEWWLRSPGYSEMYAAYVKYEDFLGGISYVESSGDNVLYSKSVRPALSIDLHSIILTSAAEGGKLSGDLGTAALMPVKNHAGKDWKVTLYDSSRDNLEVRRIDKGSVISPCCEIEIEYKNATKGTNEYLSAVLVDSDDNILYYGRFVDLGTADASSDGVINVIIPAGLTEGSTYTLRFMSEQYNGDKMTDYVSKFDSSRDVTFTVGSNIYSGNKKAIQVGCEALGAGVNTSDAAILHYDSDDNLGCNSWRVIGFNESGISSAYGRITLLANDYEFSTSAFESTGISNEYSKSNLKEVIEYIVAERFSGVEKEAIIPRNLETGKYKEYEPYCNGIANTPVSNAYIWPLSTYEANNLNNDILNYSYPWWLRSPGSIDDTAAFVESNGSVNKYGNEVIDHHFYVRPAFYLNTSYIIFTSSYLYGKYSGYVGEEALAAIGEFSGNEWKVTLHDASRDTFTVSRTDSGNILPGGKCRFSFKNAKTKADTGKEEYVSAILFDDQENPLYYGRIVDLCDDYSTGSGEASVRIPKELKNNKEYTIKFFSEQYNGTLSSDLASDPNNAVITFTTGKSTATVYDFDTDFISSKVYNGNAFEVDAKAEYGISELIDFEVIFFDEDGNILPEAPSEVGDYTFGIKVKENNYFTEKTIKDDSNWKFSIIKKTPERSDFIITTPTDLVYDGNAKEIKAELKSSLKDIGNISVSYHKLTDTAFFEIDSSPVDAGTYYFYLNVDDTGRNFDKENNIFSSQWCFTIDKAVPTEKDFNVTIPNDLTYDGSEKAVKVNTRDGANGMGEITVEYYSGNKKLKSVPKEPGSYKIKLNVAEGTNYYKAESIANDAWTYTIVPATYKVKYILNDGTINSGKVEEYIYGVGAKLPSDVTKTENTFEGWYDNAKFNGLPVIEISKTESGDKTYYAKWKPNTYNVTLNENGGKINTGKITSYTYGVGATLPTDVTKSGYTFGGWYDNAKLSGSAVKTIAKDAIGDKTYYAKWTPVPKTYTVKVSNDGNGTVTSSVASGVEGKEVTISATANEGYEFVEWQVVSGGVSLANSKSSQTTFKIGKANVEVKATFKEVTVDPPAPSVYSVSVITDGNGTAISSVASGVEGTEVTITANSNEGYEFVEWQVVSGGVSLANSKSSQTTFKIGKANVEVKATFKEVTVDPPAPTEFSINIITEGNGTATSSVASGVEGTEVTITATADEGYKFKEWQVLSGGISLADRYSAATTFNIGTANVEIKAIFIDETIEPPVPTEYCVSVITDGNGTATSSVASGVEGIEVTISATANEGFKFKEWQVLSGGISLADANSATTSFNIGTANIEIKAIFEEETINPPAPTEYSVAVFSDGNGTTTSSVTSGVEGTDVTISATANEGFKFKEWQVISGGISLADANSATTTFKIGTSNVEVKATFEKETVNPPEPVMYTVSFDANGGKGSMENVRVEAGTKYKLPECGFTAPKGKVFVKWDLGNAGDTITVNADIMLKAQWKSKVNVADIFDDINGNEWFVPYVQFVYDNGIMSGKGTKFDPDGKIRREEITQIIYSHADKPELPANSQNPFNDVDNGQWYCKGIVWCYQNGIVGGVGNGRFGVGQNVTRQDFVLMLYKYAQSLRMESVNNIDENAYKGYKDTNEVSSYAITAMNWAITNGLMGGKGTSGAPKSELRLDPKGNATRAEGATIIMQFMSEETK